MNQLWPKALACLVFAASVVPADAGKRITVEQLRNLLQPLHDRSDKGAAQSISELQLTERLSRPLLDQMLADLPGERSKQALIAVYDQSAFLDPPISEIPSKPAPSPADQRHMMGLAAGYVARTIPQLPNFFAKRTVNRFEDSPHIVQAYEAIHFVNASQGTIQYRDRRETIEDNHGHSSNGPERGLSSQGEFGFILSTVLLDAAQNKLDWLRWEQTSSMTLSIFAYSVPRERSHFELNYCCIADSEGRDRSWHEFVGYSGHIAVNPQTGAIMRIVINAELRPGQPISAAKLAVEYGEVNIGSHPYICPVHSIAFSRAQGLAKARQEIVPATAHGQVGNPSVGVVVGTTPDTAEQSLLNDITFSDYHVFRSESRIVADAGSESASPISPHPQQSAANSAITSSTLPAVNNASVSSPAVPSNVISEVTPVPTPSIETPVPGALRAEDSAVPEITTATTTSLPDLPSTSTLSTPDTGYRLRTTTRLVEVAVVAFDKRGHPITGLKPTDFEIYDNGRKQTVNSLAQVAAEASSQPAANSTAAELQSREQTFTNRPVQASSTLGASPQGISNNKTIFLIDSSHLVFADLSYARSEMLRFLQTVPADEPVGLYVLRKYGFQILKEPSTDHEQLSFTLRNWMPTAQDLAQAQSEEQRNRQQMEYVRSVGDLLSVNGNTSTGEADIFLAPDAQRRTLGDNPSQGALAFLAWVARHLAVFAGHKSLVWVSSDNALADFSEKAPSVEKGDKYLDPLALRTREALNEGHISIYPLDASQLETGGVSASLQRGNVQLNPTVNETVQLQQLPPGLREEAREAHEKSKHDINPGRLTAQMQQDTHPIQGIFRELAEATGGRALRRASDIAAELDSIVNDGRAAYTLSFTPDTPADGAYHHLAVKLRTHRDVSLRFRTGYLYEKEPATLKERFQNAVWRPADQSEIALIASPNRDGKAASVKLNIAATDLALAQQEGVWIDKLDIFLVQRDDALLHAKLDGQTLGLRLKPSTYERVLKEGINIDEPIKALPSTGVLRIVVIDENTGRIGTLTLPASAVTLRR